MICVQESVHVSRMYNRLVTVLLKYETLWLNQWRAGIENGKAGLTATLLTQCEAAGRGTRVTVNCKER